MNDYIEFLRTKQTEKQLSGFSPSFLPSFLFPFQKHLVQWAVRKGKAAIFADCGLGKTLIQLSWAENIVRKTNKPVLILAPLTVSQQTVREGKKFEIEVRQTKEGKVHKGINITNYERLSYFKPDDFSGVVCDECFPPDSLVDTINPLDNSLGKKYIKDICPGDLIINASGVDYVKATAKRRINRVVVLQIGRTSITCSENHLFFTVYGWRSAQDLQTGDYLMETEKAMCLVRDCFSSNFYSGKNAAFLRTVLLSEMEDETTRNYSGYSYERNAQNNRKKSVLLAKKYDRSRKRNFCRKNKEGRRTDTFRNCQKNDRYKNEERDFLAMERKTWGKWYWSDKASTNIMVNAFQGLEIRICNKFREKAIWISDLLQSGYRQSKITNSYRNRWAKTSKQKTNRKRQEKGRKIGFVRVDCVKILELGHPYLDKYRDEKGHVYFYDIEAIQHPSFSVNGLLVHNSGIIKGYDRKWRKAITSFMQAVPYRLLCSATPAPNDHIELGSSSEIMNEMTRNQMLAMFFTHDMDATQKWRLKKHAQKRFWQWVSGWARAVRKPSDLGYDDDGFILPELKVKKSVIPSPCNDTFFPKPARTLSEQRIERNKTIGERCRRVAEIVPSDRACIIWCQLNKESEELIRVIPESVEVRGSDKYEVKEDRLNKFSTGEIRVLVTKSRIAGLGLNWQHCRDVIYFPSHSHEAYYQAIRRCWRFGQKQPVTCSIVYTEKEKLVVDNMLRKEKQTIELYEEIVREMGQVLQNKKTPQNYVDFEIPQWINKI